MSEDTATSEVTTTEASTDADDAAEDRSATASTESNFKAINSQDELENVLKGRLKRAETAAEKKHQARIKELESIAHAHENEKLSADEKKDKQIGELTAALAERDDAIKSHERGKLVATLADDLGLPRKYHDRIRGDSEEDITADIQDFLEGLPKADKQKQSGTVKVQSTGDSGEPTLTAEDIFKNLPPHLR
jgi:hypothetical protein